MRRTGKSAGQLMEENHRQYFGLTLRPLAWVSSHWQKAVAMFADMEAFPPRQVFPLPELPDNLQGFGGAVEFDFFQSRFRRDSEVAREEACQPQSEVAAA